MRYYRFLFSQINLCYGLIIICIGSKIAECGLQVLDHLDDGLSFLRRAVLQLFGNSVQADGHRLRCVVRKHPVCGYVEGFDDFGLNAKSWGLADF